MLEREKNILKRYTLWSVVLLDYQMKIVRVCVCAHLCVTSYGFPVFVSLQETTLSFPACNSLPQFST